MNHELEKKSAPRRNLNVENAADDLGGAVGDLYGAVSELESSLDPLLSPEQDSGKGSPNRAVGDSRLAERLLSSTDTIHECAVRIRELIARL